MDKFYGGDALEPAGSKVRSLDSVLFSRTPAAHAILAWDGTELVGMAAYSFLWPAMRATVSLYLKELYVRQDHRRSGIGRLLMRHLFTYASDHGCSRMEWTADEDNTGARRFYENLGVQANPSKVFYRAENLGALAAAPDERHTPLSE